MQERYYTVDNNFQTLKEFEADLGGFLEGEQPLYNTGWMPVKLVMKPKSYEYSKTSSKLMLPFGGNSDLVIRMEDFDNEADYINIKVPWFTDEQESQLDHLLDAPELKIGGLYRAELSERGGWYQLTMQTHHPYGEDKDYIVVNKQFKPDFILHDINAIIRPKVNLVTR